MHGGSGSTDDEIKTAVKNGVVKMNVDTDTQWAYWDGLREFEKEKHDYLQGQIGNPTGPFIWLVQVSWVSGPLQYERLCGGNGSA